MKETQSVNQPATTSVFICGKPRPACVTCRRPATGACAYPLKREGQPADCGRHFCKRCHVVVKGVECCLAHARLLGASA